jgi:hypothetical protein
MSTLRSRLSTDQVSPKLQAMVIAFIIWLLWVIATVAWLVGDITAFLPVALLFLLFLVIASSYPTAKISTKSGEEMSLSDACWVNAVLCIAYPYFMYHMYQVFRSNPETHSTPH